MAAKRRTVRPRRKARSAAQKAATRRMLAANRSRSRPARAAAPKRRRRRARAAAPAAAPARRRRAVARVTRRSRRRASSGLRLGGSGSILNQGVTMLKDGAIMGAGALGVDMLMGQVNKILPDGWDSPLEGDGTPNYKNAAIKAAVAVGVGYVGARYLPASMRGLAVKAAAGSLAIQGYTLIKGSIPADFLPLGGATRMQPSRLAGAPLNTLRIPAQAPGNTGSLGMAPLNAVRYYTR